MSDLTITYHKHFIVELSANRSTFQLKPRKHLTQFLRPDRAVLRRRKIVIKVYWSTKQYTNSNSTLTWSTTHIRLKGTLSLLICKERKRSEAEKVKKKQVRITNKPKSVEVERFHSVAQSSFLHWVENSTVTFFFFLSVFSKIYLYSFRWDSIWQALTLTREKKSTVQSYCFAIRLWRLLSIVHRMHWVTIQLRKLQCRWE